VRASATEVGTFTHGVASFDPAPDRVLLWTRAVGASSVRWFLDDDGGSRREGTVECSPASDWCVVVDVDGLAPASTYRYWFEVGPDRSPTGRTRTLGGDGPVTVAVICCTDVSAGWFGACRAIAEDDVDLVLHLGDAMYEQFEGKRRPQDLHGPSITHEDYRARHRATRADPDMRAMHQSHPMCFVWDDHDVADNAWRHGAKAHDVDEHGSFAARLEAAARARQEWLPARLIDPAAPIDMHRSVVLSSDAELVVLDTRIPGRDEHADHEGSPPIDDPDRSLLGADQRTWATERILDRTRRWSIVATSVTMSPLQLPIADRDVPKLNAALPSGYAIVHGVALCTDEWDGYPAERARMVEAIRRRGDQETGEAGGAAPSNGVVIVSGDVHSSWLLELRDESDAAVAVEFVCPALTSLPMGRQLPRPAHRLAQHVGEGMDHCRWVDVTRNGWLRLEIGDQVRADWFAVGADAPRPIRAGRGDHMAGWEMKVGGAGTLRSSLPTAPIAPGSVEVLDLPPPPAAPSRVERWRTAIRVGRQRLSGS
jgi:alkaline phosphatase D